MHETVIDSEVIRRVTERRGGLRVFNSIVSKRTAHIVVDLQNGFMAPGEVAEIGTARDIVPNVNRISDAVRQSGGLVVYIQNTFDEIAVSTWSTFFDHFCSPERRARMIAAFSPGAEGHALWPDLDVLPEDLKVQKPSLRCLRTWCVGPACDLASPRHRYADRHRNRVPGVLRIHGA